MVHITSGCRCDPHLQKETKREKYSFLRRRVVQKKKNKNKKKTKQKLTEDASHRTAHITISSSFSCRFCLNDRQMNGRLEYKEMNERRKRMNMKQKKEMKKKMSKTMKERMKNVERMRRKQLCIHTLCGLCRVQPFLHAGTRTTTHLNSTIDRPTTTTAPGVSDTRTQR